MLYYLLTDHLREARLMIPPALVFGLGSAVCVFLLGRRRDVIRWLKWAANGDPEGRLDTPGSLLFVTVALTFGATVALVGFLASSLTWLLQ